MSKAKSRRTNKPTSALAERKEGLEKRDVETGSTRRGRPGGRGKSSDPNCKQVTAYIKGATYTNVRIKLLERLKHGKKQDFSELVEQLLSEWLRT